MNIKELNLGNLDAKNELLTDSPEEKDYFIKSYVLPPNLDINNFIENRRYFILGLKGTGKTALLRYVSIRKEQVSDAVHSRFILFKTELSDDDRQDLASLRNNQDESHPDGSLTKIEQINTSHGVESLTPTVKNDTVDSVYVLNWKFFIYKKIVEFQTQSEKEINLFQRTQDWNDFLKLVNAANDNKSWIPTLKRGELELSNDPSLKLEFESNGAKKCSIKFNSYIKKLDSLFEELLPGKDEMNIFFDELEISFYKRKQRARDVRLIRDLIIAIDGFNSVCKRKSFKINIFAAIRSEIKNIVESAGVEINKPLSDFGVELTWNQAGIGDNDQPILTLITQRLKHQIPNGYNITDNDVWIQLFPERVQNENIKKYILHNSWYRPRDVIRLLKLAQDHSPMKSEKFTHAVFDNIRKKYAEESWNELKEELTAKYKPNYIESIERIFENFKTQFTMQDFFEQVDIVKDLYGIKIGDDRDFLKKLLIDLYNIGFLGNVEVRRDNKLFKFFYRGDYRVCLTEELYVHPSIRKYFNLKD